MSHITVVAQSYDPPVLNQAEADALLAMPKRFVDPQPITLSLGDDYRRELTSVDHAEKFVLDVRRNQFRVRKFRYQERARKVDILLRLCIEGPPHTNPDGSRVGRSHLHTFRAGYNDKFAAELDAQHFADPSDAVRTFEDFCRYANIVNWPTIQPGIGSTP